MVGSNSFGKRLLRLYLPLAGYALFLLFPFLWMLIVSFKPDQELLDTRANPFLLAHVTFEHYRYLFAQTDFLRWTMNTFIVTVGATLISLLCSVLIGYALGRFRFRGGNLLGVAIFLAYLVPPTLTIGHERDARLGRLPTAGCPPRNPHHQTGPAQSSARTYRSRMIAKTARIGNM